ncbi:MAG: MoaD/ThiS family protein [Candidatus Thorarchaeota archaeon]
MKFKSFGPIRRVLGSSVIEVDVPENATVRQVIDKILEIGGDDLRRLVMNQNKVSGNLIIMLNKRDVSLLGGENTRVAEGDEVTALPHVQGG